MDNSGVLTEEDKRFISHYVLLTPYQSDFNEPQRYVYINRLNEALKYRASMPIYLFG